MSQRTAAAFGKSDETANQENVVIA